MDAAPLIDLDVTDVAHGGVFIARHEGRVVFVSDAIPGERVRARVADAAGDAAADSRRFWRAETVEVLDASPHRRPHVWRSADVDTPPEERPGGADFGHISLEHQRALKGQVVSDALRRMAGLDLAVEVAPPVAPPAAPRAAQPAAQSAAAGGPSADAESADGTGWRTRVSLHVDQDGRIGPYAARSHRVVPVSSHPLATEAVESAALALRLAQPGRVDLVQPSDGRVRVIPRPERARTPRGAAARRGRRPTVRRADAPAKGDPAREVVLERVGDRAFRVDAGGFWQVHRLAAASLSHVVAGALTATNPQGLDPDAHHLDLYGGVGLFAAVLGTAGGPSTRVTSVESDPRATEHAGENLAEWVGARAETGRVDRWLAQFEDEASAAQRERLTRGVVLLDPPRAGAGRDVVESIARLAPATVVYVACDPVALARDLATFHAAGYDTTAVTGLDLFPHSHHVETVATLTRSGRHH